MLTFSKPATGRACTWPHLCFWPYQAWTAPYAALRAPDWRGQDTLLRLPAGHQRRVFPVSCLPSLPVPPQTTTDICPISLLPFPRFLLPLQAHSCPQSSDRPAALRPPSRTVPSQAHPRSGSYGGPRWWIYGRQQPAWYRHGTERPLPCTTFPQHARRPLGLAEVTTRKKLPRAQGHDGSCSYSQQNHVVLSGSLRLDALRARRRGCAARVLPQRHFYRCGVGWGRVEGMKCFS